MHDAKKCVVFLWDEKMKEATVEQCGDSGDMI